MKRAWGRRKDDEDEEDFFKNPTLSLAQDHLHLIIIVFS